MRRTSYAERVPPEFPKDAVREIDTALVTSISGKGAYAGETLVNLVDRHCPEIYGIATRLGYRLIFDIPENTQRALSKGRLHYVIRPALH